MTNLVRGLETVYDNRINWGVDVINMSLEEDRDRDGTEAWHQLIDLGVSMGIVVVVAAGNFGPSNTIGSPAAATRAITVASSNDMDSVFRSDDRVADNSARGPRASDNDLDCIDELKPEVTAPGVDIIGAMFNTANGPWEQSGTSMAAPHVAGLAALIIQARPGINAASVKDLIIASAEGFGLGSSPLCNLTWNDQWGWGLVNGFDALNQLTASTNLRFPSHPPSTIWLSPDIVFPDGPPKRNQTHLVRVTIRNDGANAAFDVRVHLGAQDLATNLPVDAFDDIGTQIVVSLPGNTSQDVDFLWTPTADGHMCLKAEIGYGPDTDYSDNRAQRNVTVAASPITFKVRNSLTEAAATITFEPTFEWAGACSGNAEPCNDDSVCPTNEQCIPQTWTVDVNPPSVTLGADDCPEEVQVDLQPAPDTMLGSRQTVHVAAKIGGTLIGGISVESNPDQTAVDPPLPIDIPTLSEWGLILLAFLLLSLGIFLQRRHSSRIPG